MSARFYRAFGIFVFVVLLSSLPMDRSFAISVELARKCQALTDKQFPPRVVGNPAAGSAKGSGLEQQAFFKKCIANGGK